MKSGYIYVIKNKMYSIYGSNVYKIGTTNNIKQRASSLYVSYLEPPQFMFISKIFPNKYTMEKKIHILLGEYRINKHKEFFKAPLKTIIDIIIELEDISDTTERLKYIHKIK